MALAIAGACALRVALGPDVTAPLAVPRPAPARPVPEPAPHLDRLALPEPEVPRRVALGPEPVRADPRDEAALRPGSVSLLALRWPDRAPLAGRVVRVLAEGEVVEGELSPRARLPLDPAWADAAPAVRVHIEGFEPCVVSATADDDRVEYRALLTPATGWIGRVLDADGSPLADTRVRGFWVEAPRPFENGVAPDVFEASVRARLEPPARDLAGEGGDAGEEDSLAARVARKRALRQALEAEAEVEVEVEAEALPLHFLGAHDEVRASAPTDDEGWFWLPPLPGPVLGQLTLLADTDEASSDVLRLPLPWEGRRLPDLLVHDARPLSGEVVDVHGNPLAGVHVLVELRDGWSPQWQPGKTDDVGRFTFVGPWWDLAVAVEKVGYRLAAPDLWKPASADGLWPDVESLAGGAAHAALYGEAYGQWRAPLARARAYREVDRWRSDVRLVLEELPRLCVIVEAADVPSQPLTDATVEVRYGGLDRGARVVDCDAQGRAWIPLAEREWQPTVVHASAPGYLPRTFALAPEGRFGDIEDDPPHPVRVRLERGASLLGGGAPVEPEPNGRVRDAAGPVRGARVFVVDRSPGSSAQLWRGSADEEGGFHYEFSTVGVSAYEVVALTDDASLAGTSGQLQVAAATDGRVVEVSLGPAPTCEVTVQNLDAARRYRVDWSLRVQDGGEPVAEGRLEVPRPTSGRGRLEVPAVPGWFLDVRVLGSTVGSAPTMALARERGPYTSTGYWWTGWDPVVDPAHMHVPFDGGRVWFTAARLVDLSGTVTGIPWDLDPDAVVVGALRESGSWFAPVSHNGWFDLRDLPAGEYRLVVVERLGATGLEEGLPLVGQAVVRAEARVDCRWSTHGLRLVWSGAEVAEDVPAEQGEPEFDPALLDPGLFGPGDY